MDQNDIGHLTNAIIRQIGSLDRIAAALERTNALIFHMLSNEQKQALQKSDLPKSSSKARRP